jgi:diguanylate cyclase (GGDEF)-like protein
LTPGLLRKRLVRALMVSWREQPTRYDIEALQANIRRVGLVIRLRWALLVVLVLYSLFGGLAFASRMPANELASRMAIPAIALCVVVLYNTFYQLNYKRLGNISLWNHLQLALDALMVTVLVFYSGGVNSWFWSMYALFILEAAFILPRRRDAWLLTIACIALLGAVEYLELLRILPQVGMPFANPDPHDAVFVAVRFGWQVAVLCGAAAVSTQLVGAQRSESAGRQQLVVLDEATGMFSRAYLLRALPAEVSRALRDNRALHLLLIDVDHFGDFNRSFGIETGDAVLSAIAQTVTRVVGESADALMSGNIIARFGGEEFVVLLAEETEVGGAPQVDDAMRLAERLREQIASTRVQGAGVTVSIGVASLPFDAASSEELLDGADAALALAIERGGDQVARLGMAEEPDDERPDADTYRDSLES